LREMLRGERREREEEAGAVSVVIAKMKFIASRARWLECLS
jgi:hypothetical protein